MKNKARARELPTFDKYFHYLHAVQSPEENMAFLRQIHRELRAGPGDESPGGLVLREDFCGTFANACAWVRADAASVAYGIDNDPEPIAYGRAHYLPELTPEQQARVHIAEGDVLAEGLPRADVIAALNFSYCFFRDRATLRRYFEACRRSLKSGGVFVLDQMGGAFYMGPNEHESELDDLGYSYFLEQLEFDPITSEADFQIHFKRKGEKKRERVFTYRFRMWSLPELRDLLLECGFARVEAYWEGSKRDGSGDGVWSRAAHGESCDSWLAYLAATAD